MGNGSNSISLKENYLLLIYSLLANYGNYTTLRLLETD